MSPARKTAPQVRAVQAVQTVQTVQTVQSVHVESTLTLDELCRACHVTPQWVHERVAAGLLPALPAGPAAWRFEVTTLRRVHGMVWLERDFDAVPELAALVADLEDEIERLRRQLERPHP